MLGQSAKIRVRSLPHAVCADTVVRMGIESDRVHEERRVWVSCPDCADQVFLGEQAKVRVILASLTDSLLVPEIAIAGFDGHQGRLWVVQDGRFAEVMFIFGHRTEDARAEVVSGLPDGAQIVASPVKGRATGHLARISARAP